MNKKYYGIALTTLNLLAFMSNAEPLTLKDPVIKLIDGMRIGVDGEKIGFMLKIRLRIKTMQYGTKIAPNVFKGEYIFQNKPYSINELVHVESKFKTAHDADPKKITELSAVLADAKQDFVKEIMSFMETARGMKKHITKLIDESCKRRDRKDSELRRWGAAKEGHEEKQFNDDIKDFKTFDAFCTDLSNFLEDLIHSCPKGRKQLQQMIASHQAK